MLKRGPHKTSFHALHLSCTRLYERSSERIFKLSSNYNNTSINHIAFAYLPSKAHSALVDDKPPNFLLM